MELSIKPSKIWNSPLNLAVLTNSSNLGKTKEMNKNKEKLGNCYEKHLMKVVAFLYESHYSPLYFSIGNDYQS
jgi:hypothetical protein